MISRIYPLDLIEKVSDGLNLLDLERVISVVVNQPSEIDREKI